MKMGGMMYFTLVEKVFPPIESKSDREDQGEAESTSISFKGEQYALGSLLKGVPGRTCIQNLVAFTDGGFPVAPFLVGLCQV